MTEQLTLTLRSCKLSVEIAFHSILQIFELLLSNLALRKLSLGISKVPHHGDGYSKFPLIKSVHLVKNEQQEEP